MKKYMVGIHVMPRKELLDPQGKTVALGLHSIGLDQISDVRIGKRIQFEITATDENEARQLAEESCHKLLANPVMESYEISVEADL